MDRERYLVRDRVAFGFLGESDGEKRGMFVCRSFSGDLNPTILQLNEY